jgi:hypothetical protein
LGRADPIGKKTVHFLVSHPTPPVFDGPEDRNGTRNYDEIRFWADYITPGKAGYIYDDNGQWGGLKPGSLFVIAGDQNSDPNDGDSIPGSIQLLLDHPLVNTKVTPASEGAVEASLLQGGANLTHISDPAYDTADFADGSTGEPTRRLCSAAQDAADHGCGGVLAADDRSLLLPDRRVPVPVVGPPAGVG